jgi:DNA-binding Xre family transcriptional regulator
MKKFKTLPSKREKKIRILLINKNLTSKTLAEFLDISEELLSYKLRNDAWKADDIPKLCKFFKIPTNELLNLEGK